MLNLKVARKCTQRLIEICHLLYDNVIVLSLFLSTSKKKGVEKKYSTKDDTL